MNFDILTIFYFIAGFTILIAIGIAGSAINQLMGIRIQRPHLVLKDRSELPAYLNDVFESGLNLLQSLGFEYHHCQYTLDILCHQRNDKWSLVLINKQTNVFAEISPASSFLDLPGYEIDFWSIASDGSAMITMNGRGHTILCGITKAEIHDPMAITLSDAYQSHLSERADVFVKKPVVSPSSESYIKNQQKLFDGYFLNLMNERAVISTGKNEFRLSFAKARRLLPQVLHGQKRLRKLLHEKLVWQESQQNKSETEEHISLSGDNFPVEAEVESYQRMRSVEERTPGGLTAKLVLFALVLALTYLAFNLHFSIYSLIIIVTVFALHEIGHLAAMMAFGYRDYRVLFFPILVNASRTDNVLPDIWKQIIVYLMGPVPGIIIGLTFLGFSQEYEISWFYETAIVFLVVNYLNLLPIAPLDGGHLIRLTIMERFPSGKLILTGMGGLAFAAGGWYLGEAVFWLIALILFSTLPWGALEAGVLSDLFQPTSDFEKLDKKDRLKNLFETFRQPQFSKLLYLQKFNLIKGLSDTLLLPKHLGRLGALGFNAVYLGALLLTPPAAIITMIGMDNTVDMVAKIQGKAPDKNWSTLIENSDTPENRFKTTLKAARFYTSTNDFDSAQSFLEQAEKTLALIYSNVFQAELYSTYSFYYLTRQELGAAEEQQMKVIKLLDQSPQDNAFELTTSYQNLATIHDLQNDTSALLDLKTALSYAINTRLPEERYVIITVINQLLNKFYASLDYNGAKTILLDSISILSRHTDTPSKYVAGFLYQELAWINIMTGELNDAIKQLENSYTLSNDNAIRVSDISSYGYDPFASVNILLTMALVQSRAGNINSSDAYLQKAETLLKTDYSETLSGYLESNLTEISGNSDNTANVLSVNNQPSIAPELQRKTQRWEMIAQIVEKNSERTEPLELPKSATAVKKVTNPATVKNETNSGGFQKKIVSTSDNRTTVQPDKTAGTLDTNPASEILPESSDTAVTENTITQTRLKKPLEIPPLPGESNSTDQTSPVASQSKPSADNIDTPPDDLQNDSKTQ